MSANTNLIETKTYIFMASSIKEAKQIAGPDYIYVKPYKYASKGNNFYQFRKLI